MTVIKFIFGILGIVVLLCVLNFIFVITMIDGFKNMPCCEGKPEQTNVEYTYESSRKNF